MTNTFAQLGLPAALVRALTATNITEPFPVQAATIPDALDGRDVSGKAPTGSGKTLAFGLPVLAGVPKAGRNRPAALVLAPTRELAEQIKSELAPLAKAVSRSVFAVYGGVGYGNQKQALRKGVDVLVATPGRLEDLIEQRIVDLSRSAIVVVDEADRMADMGFLPAVRRILDQTPKSRQTLLFSATLDGDIAVLKRDYQRDPIRHEVGGIEPRTVDARHHFWLVEHNQRVRHAADLISEVGRSIVFTRTRRGADRLSKQLARIGVGAVAMHGGRSQNQRNRALRSFTAGRAQALVATDVAARGIHIDAVASVLHFDPPADSKDYVHRSGRTARAGESGTVVSLVTHDQRRAVRRMQRDLDLDVPIETPRLERLASAPEPNAHKPNAHKPNAQQQGVAKRQPPTATASRTTDSQLSQSADEATSSIYVSNLPWATTAEEMMDLFGRHGRVQESTIIENRHTGRSRGFGFVEMPKEAAESAIEALHGSKLRGRELTVRFAKPRRYGPAA